MLTLFLPLRIFNPSSTTSFSLNSGSSPPSASSSALSSPSASAAIRYRRIRSSRSYIRRKRWLFSASPPSLSVLLTFCELLEEILTLPCADHLRSASSPSARLFFLPSNHTNSLSPADRPSPPCPSIRSLRPKLDLPNKRDHLCPLLPPASTRKEHRDDLGLSVHLRHCGIDGGVVGGRCAYFL